MPSSTTQARLQLALTILLPLHIRTAGAIELGVQAFAATLISFLIISYANRSLNVGATRYVLCSFYITLLASYVTNLTLRSPWLQLIMTYVLSWSGPQDLAQNYLLYDWVLHTFFTNAWTSGQDESTAFISAIRGDLAMFGAISALLALLLEFNGQLKSDSLAGAIDVVAVMLLFGVAAEMRRLAELAFRHALVLTTLNRRLSQGSPELADLDQDSHNLATSARQ